MTKTNAAPQKGFLPAVKRFLKSKKMVTLVWILGVIVIWEIFAFIVAATKRTPVNVLPHLWEIIGSFFSDKKVTGKFTMIELIGTSCAETLSRAGIGFLIGTLLGYVLALLMNLSRVVEKIAFPYLMIIQMIPILGMAPIILSITGDISTARIVIAAILTFYPVSTNVLAGFKSVEREKHELMYSYAANKFQLYTKTLIPACIPYFFTGLKISAPMAITASILVDTLQGGNGLGCMLSQSLKGGMTRLVFWDIVLISAMIGILSFVLMGLLEKLICPYKRTKSTD
ncbi:MAG: ABC transporter permease [Oscillospiraceae bacterium]